MLQFCTSLLVVCCLASPSKAQFVGDEGFVLAVAPELTGEALHDFITFVPQYQVFTLYVHVGPLPAGITRAEICLGGLYVDSLTARGPAGWPVSWEWISQDVLVLDVAGACQMLPEGGILAELDIELGGLPSLVINPCQLTFGYEDCSSVSGELYLESGFEGVLVNPDHFATASSSWGLTKTTYRDPR